MKKDKGAITWLQANNWFPLMAAMVTMTGVFYGFQLKNQNEMSEIKTEIALVKLGLEQVSNNQNEMLSLFKNVESRYGILALDVKELQTLEGIDKQ